MRTLFAILTIVLVGIHAFVGCCWHHGHSCAAGPDQHAICEQTESHGDHSEDSHEPQSPHHDICQQAPCVFTTADGPCYDLAPQVAPWVPRDNDANVQLASGLQTPLEWTAVHSPAATIPMRLHLFKGLLLI